MIRVARRCLMMLCLVFPAGLTAQTKPAAPALPAAPADIGLPQTAPPAPKAVPAKAPKGQPAKGAIVGFASMVEGGRIDLDGRIVKLFDVALPKSSWPCIEWQGTKQVNGDCVGNAEAMLASLVEGKTIACVIRPEGDSAAICYVDGKDVAEELVTAGWAANCRVSGRYSEAELTAQRFRKGVWLGNGGAAPAANLCQ